MPATGSKTGKGEGMRSESGNSRPVQGYPTPWLAAQAQDADQWIRELSDAERQGLLLGLEAFESSGTPLSMATGDDFPFRNLAQLKADIEATLYRHLGFIVLRGMPLEGLTVERIEALYWGFCNHLGVLRPQGQDSGLIKSVRDAGGNYRSASGRGYNTSAELDFHTDFADLVGLLCINTAQSGGLSRISSSQAVRAAMEREAPQLVRALFEPIYYSRQGEESPHERPYYRTPIFSERDGWFSCRYTRNHIRYAHRFEGVPHPWDEQIAAMDLLDKTVVEPDFVLEMSLQPGDMQILNNHVILHSRTAYTDHEEEARKRHLLRAWIANPGSQPLDPLLEEAYHDVRPGAVRGGIIGQAFDMDKAAYTRKAAAYHGMPQKSAPEPEDP